jgi:hypothetical protein
LSREKAIEVIVQQNHNPSVLMYAHNSVVSYMDYLCKITVNGNLFTVARGFLTFLSDINNLVKKRRETPVNRKLKIRMT